MNNEKKQITLSYLSRFMFGCIVGLILLSMFQPINEITYANDFYAFNSNIKVYDINHVGNYLLILNNSEIANKIITLGIPTTKCGFSARFSNFGNNSWCSIGLINKGKYKYASFEKRYGMDFRAMTYNKSHFLNDEMTLNKEFSSDFTLNQYYNITENWHYYEIIIYNNFVNFYIDNTIVATIRNNTPKKSDLYFHIQLSSLEHANDFNDNMFIEVKDIKLGS